MLIMNSGWTLILQDKEQASHVVTYMEPHGLCSKASLLSCLLCPHNALLGKLFTNKWNAIAYSYAYTYYSYHLLSYHTGTYQDISSTISPL